MNSQTPAQEPTMEEILASIRRIISEDSGGTDIKGSSPAAVSPVAGPAPMQAPPPHAREEEPQQDFADEDYGSDETVFEDEQVLELTEALPEEGEPETYTLERGAEPVAAQPSPHSDATDSLLDETIEFDDAAKEEPVVHFMPEPAEIYEQDVQAAPQEIAYERPRVVYQQPAPAPVEAGAPEQNYISPDYSEQQVEEYEDDISFEETAQETVMNAQPPIQQPPIQQPMQAQVAPSHAAAYAPPLHGSAPEAPPLMSDAAAGAASAAFGELTNSILHAQGGGKTLEEIVIEMLRPMLKDWLDDNLPGLVENMVRSEIDRISRRVR